MSALSVIGLQNAESGSAEKLKVHFQKGAHMTQIEYERLMNTLARTLGTWRRYIRLVRSVPLGGGCVAYSVNWHGFYYRITLCGDTVKEVARETSLYAYGR